MGPGRYGGSSASVGAAAVAMAVAVLVIAIVAIGGGLNRPLTASPQVTAAVAAAPGPG